MYPPDATVRVFVENAAGSSEKNTYDETTLAHLGSAAVSAPYPYAYGFVRDTRSGDGDAVDCFVVTDRPLLSGTLVDCTVLHLLEQVEDGAVDHKVLAVPADAAAALPDGAEAAIRTFIETVFAHVPGKEMRLGELRDAGAALDYLRASGLTPGPDRAP